MTKILTDTGWEELLAESEQKGILCIQSKGTETIHHGEILDICNTY